MIVGIGALCEDAGDQLHLLNDLEALQCSLLQRYCCLQRDRRVNLTNVELQMNQAIETLVFPPLGKERTGKERGGKERKGKERKGKERKGKERKRKERTGKKRKGKKTKGKERKGKERKGKERKGKERKGKERKGALR